jgi:uncharacterized membrane protein YbhN (UPF0104 family)
LTHKQKVQLLTGFALAAGLLAWFLHGQNWSEIGEAFRHARPLDLAGLVLFTIVAYIVRSWRWGYLYRPLARVPFKDLLSATYIGFMSALLVPRSGEVLRPYLIARRHPVSTSSGFATVILERLIDLITVLSLFAVYLYILTPPAAEKPDLLELHLPLVGTLAGRGVAGLAILSLLAICLGFLFWADRAMKIADWVFARLPAKLGVPLASLGHSFGQGLAILKAPVGLLAAIFAQSVLLWLSIAAGFYFNNVAFGIELPFHSTFLLIAFLTVGVAVPTPGSVGGFHVAYQLAMNCFGVSKATGTAAGISAHALTNLPVLVIGLVFLAGEGLTMGKVAALAGGEAGEPKAEGGEP